jgi:hypothetical protein
VGAGLKPLSFFRKKFMKRLLSIIVLSTLVSSTVCSEQIPNFLKEKGDAVYDTVAPYAQAIKDSILNATKDTGRFITKNPETTLLSTCTALLTYKAISDASEKSGNIGESIGKGMVVTLDVVAALAFAGFAYYTYQLSNK